MPLDWTEDETGRSNSSERFQFMEREVASMIIDEAHAIVSGKCWAVAGFILAELTHRYGFTTQKTLEEMRAESKGI